MRVLVTGGSGFIGSNLALALEEAGHEVVAADRTLRSENLEGFRGEVVETESRGVSALKGPFEVVFHHGDITDPRHSGKENVLEANVSGFQGVAELCLRENARLVYASSAGLYGNGPVPMKEDQEKIILTDYGRSKLKMDELGRELSERIPVVGLRYFNVFGPREAHKGRPASMVLHLGRQMREGKAPGLFNYGEQKRDFIYVKDVCAAAMKAAEAPSGIYNVGTGVPTTFNELVVVLNKALGTNFAPEYFPMPYDPATYQSDTQADTALAESRLGFRYSWGLQDAVRDYFGWLDSHGW